jgi:hypothetical protein
VSFFQSLSAYWQALPSALEGMKRTALPRSCCGYHRGEVSQSSCMSPTGGMYHSRPTDLVIRCTAVGLENVFKLSQEPLRPIASTA